MNGVQEGGKEVFQGFISMSPMLDLEFSYGRWSGTDVETLEFPLKSLLARARGLPAFANRFTRQVYKHSSTIISSTTTVVSDPSDVQSQKVVQVDAPSSSRHPSRLHLRDQITQLEAAQHAGVEDLVPVLRDATAELRSAASQGPKVYRVRSET